MKERTFLYYENGTEETLTLTELQSMFNSYSVEERQHDDFTSWVDENIKMQILIER